MIDLAEKDYVLVVQCHIVTQRCSGYACLKAFNDRSGGFADYPADKEYRFLPITCGGCCGKATHRKIKELVGKLKSQEDLDPERIVVQLSSCMTRSNFHSSRCPYTKYIKGLVQRFGIDCREDTALSELSEKRRQEGIYA